jgi:hypothetical protein
MNVSLIDIRTSTDMDEMRNLIARTDAPIIVILGHGARNSIGSSIAGFTAETFPIPSSARVLWFYACNCGESMIGKIAQRGPVAFGYLTSILAPASVEATVANRIKTYLEDYTDSVDPILIRAYVQERLLEDARQLSQDAKNTHNGLLLLQAALINHTRLSLRFASIGTLPS